ncbi:hypothetical protein GF336_05820 [Candidatus Woesearchaeota archaeon]|nr:hypothetical protein [Candidatus Woesearchaeota archaeon]
MEKTRQPEFISKTEISDHCRDIEIPEGSNLLRTIKGNVNFYEGHKPEGSKNGWSQIPEEYIPGYVSFPGYRPKSGNYGSPLFRKKD